MAKSISWERLLEIYENTRWGEDQDEILVANESILETLIDLEESDKLAFDADISVLVPPETISINQCVPARVGRPKLQLGVLADDFDGVLSTPGSRIHLREKFFLKSNKKHSGSEPEVPEFSKYKSMISFISALGMASLFIDETRQLLVYYKDRRIEIPIFYKKKDLDFLKNTDVSKLCSLLAGDVHREQRATILSEVVISLVENIPRDSRFLHLVRNLSEINSRLTEGYKLFASSFSYSKIRNEVEATQAEYVNRIHKTFTDIQGQLLGLPIATVVVASQLKVAKDCSIEAWGNLAVLIGAWLFAVLILASCLNQWLTLRSISEEINSQRKKLNEEFSELNSIFVNKFKTLNARLYWHRVLLVAISLISIAGGCFATSAFHHFNQISIMYCVP